MKEAQVEADKEVAAYKDKKEREFLAAQNEV